MAADGGSHRAGIVGDEQAVLPIGDGFTHAAFGHGHDRHAAGVRLQRRQPERLQPRGVNHHRRPVQDVQHGLVADADHWLEHHVLFGSETAHLVEIGGDGDVADPDQSGPWRSDGGHRLDAERMVLFGDE